MQRSKHGTTRRLIRRRRAAPSAVRLRQVPAAACWLLLRVSWLGGQVGHHGTGSAGASPSSASTNAPTAPQPVSDRNGFSAGLEWSAALELTIATHGAEPYKSRLRELFPQMITEQQIGSRGWTAVRALPYLDPTARDQMREAVKTYMAGLEKQLDATPFGVPPSLGGWGGSGAVVDMAIRTYFLHKTFPDLVGPEYTLRAVNYILGTHPVSSTSYVAGVG